MGFRWQVALGAAASLLLIASCGGTGSKSTDATTPKSSTPTASLPLQPVGLAVGGDVQSRATDVLKRGITEEQAKRIAEACARAAEIANNAAQDCREAIVTVLRSSQPSCEALLCLEAFDVSSLSKLGYKQGSVKVS